MSAKEETPIFVYNNARINYPTRREKKPTGKFDKHYLESGAKYWTDFCQIAVRRLSTDTPSRLLMVETLTAEHLEDSFALSKSYIRKEVLGQENGQKGIRLAYQYFILGENIDGMPQDNPHLVINRQELFQLYTLQIVHEYNCMSAAGKRVFIERDIRKYSGGNITQTHYIA